MGLSLRVAASQGLGFKVQGVWDGLHLTAEGCCLLGYTVLCLGSLTVETEKEPPEKVFN